VGATDKSLKVNSLSFDSPTPLEVLSLASQLSIYLSLCTHLARSSDWNKAIFGPTTMC